MPYVPKTWETGDVIEATDLNHMENAIGALYITASVVEGNYTLSVTYNDILAALNNGKTVAVKDESLIKYLVEYGYLNDKYYASFLDALSLQNVIFSANDTDTPLVVDQS